MRIDRWGWRSHVCFMGGRRIRRGQMNGDIELEIDAGSGVRNYAVRVIRAAAGGEPVGALELDVEELLSRREVLEATVLASLLDSLRLIMQPGGVK